MKHGLRVGRLAGLAVVALFGVGCAIHAEEEGAESAGSNLDSATVCGAAKLQVLIPSLTGKEQSTSLTCGADGLFRGTAGTPGTNSSIRFLADDLKTFGDSDLNGYLDAAGNSLTFASPVTLNVLVDFRSKAYHLTPKEQPTAVVAKGATVFGTALSGGKLAVDYDVTKLTSCMNFHSGWPAWGTQVVATFLPSGKQVTADVLGRDPADAHRNIKQIPLVDLPVDATWVKLSFVSRNNENCSQVDDNQGAGYRVPVASATRSLTTETKRTVVLIYGVTQPGQDMFIRGGLDHEQMFRTMGASCTPENHRCAIPIGHRNFKNATTAPWKLGDSYLDWYGTEPGQSPAAQGTPLDWTTNAWPSSWGAAKTVFADGFGVEPLNTAGQHYWMLDVDMDCRAGYHSSPYDPTSWFEVKSFISNGPGWEGDVKQADAPYASRNHFGKCGMVNVFRRGDSTVSYLPL